MRHKILPLIIFILVVSCKTQELLLIKENQPTVITKEVSEITNSSANLNGEVSDEGFTAITDRGFVYSDKNTNPSVSDTKVQSGYGIGLYSFKLDNLKLNTKYYLNAYATNTKGTSYGAVKSFTTLESQLPTVITDVPLNITNTSVDLGGSVTNTGGLTITERGICIGDKSNPSTPDYKQISDKGLGAFKVSIRFLSDNTKYYVRAYAINSKGTAYGNEQTFSSLDAPVIPRTNTTKVVEVKSETGRIWMDRNLGAIQAATSKDDINGFGDLYQWGRGSDGHQIRTSGTTTTLATSDKPTNSNFNVGGPEWQNPPNNNLWQGVNGLNNPCPSGFRLPTDSELKLEYFSWIYKTSNGAFASPLKLPVAGMRSNSGSIISLLSSYWSSSSSTISGGIINSMDFYLNGVIPGGQYRAIGASVRCIKN